MVKQTAYGSYRSQKRAGHMGTAGIQSVTGAALGLFSALAPGIRGRLIGVGIAGLNAVGAYHSVSMGRAANSGQHRAINHLVRRAAYEKRARQQAVNGYVTVKGHYTSAGSYVRQHQRRVG